MTGPDIAVLFHPATNRCPSPALGLYRNPRTAPENAEAATQPQLYSPRGLHGALLSIFCNHIMIKLAAREFTICYAY